ncbi:hypothetical protein [Phreatobacter sp.]|uniref:hypothetical protein n=1 Tax=Phreatobacter sp. TaxID=1966341 RepID=UPI0022C71182|nr:hypothetical protein [Phreatobacter sp.]MCZ8314131.1 hypothetical protein [Phreatobacter sp.]
MRKAKLVPDVGIDPKGDLEAWARWAAQAGISAYDQLKGRGAAAKIRDFAVSQALNMMNEHSLYQGHIRGLRLAMPHHTNPANVLAAIGEYESDYAWRRLWWIGEIRKAYIDYRIELLRNPIGRGNPPKHFRIMMLETPRTDRDRRELTRDRWELSLAIKAFDIRRERGSFRGLDALVDTAREAGAPGLDENSNERVKRMARDLWRDSHVSLPADLAAAIEHAQKGCKNLLEYLPSESQS